MIRKFIYLLFSFSVIGCTTLNDPFYKEILSNAQHDIQVDSVKYFSYGLPFVRPVVTGSKISPSDSIQFEKDSLKWHLIEYTHNKYGLHKRPLGCVISKQTMILSKKYKKETDPYLEKRNGKAWKQKMEQEIDSIRNAYN